MPNYNTHLITARRCYRMKDIADLYRINKRTCRRWIIEGLKVVEANTSSPLIMGKDLILFLKNKQAKKKIKLKDDELYCVKCRKGVKAKIGSEKIIKTGKTIGKANKELLIKSGVCENCGTRLNRYANEII